MQKKVVFLNVPHRKCMLLTAIQKRDKRLTLNNIKGKKNGILIAFVMLPH